MIKELPGFTRQCEAVLHQHGGEMVPQDRKIEINRLPVLPICTVRYKGVGREGSQVVLHAAEAGSLE
jgi:hypothetical protein